MSGCRSFEYMSRPSLTAWSTTFWEARVNGHQGQVLSRMEELCRPSRPSSSEKDRRTRHRISTAKELRERLGRVDLHMPDPEREVVTFGRYAADCSNRRCLT